MIFEEENIKTNLLKSIYVYDFFINTLYNADLYYHC